MAAAGSLGVIEHVEDWFTDNISASAGAAADGLHWLTLIDAGTAFARAAAAGRGLHLAGAVATAAADLTELCSDTLFVYGQEGTTYMEVLFQCDSFAAMAFNIGFNDDSLDASNTLPAELSTTTWTSNAGTFVGLVYDTDATNDEVHCFWVDDDADSTTAIASLRMTGAAPVASKWAAARIELHDRGSGNGVRAVFSWSQDGKSVVKEFDTTVDRDAALCPYLGFESRGTASNIYIKYIKIGQSIAD